MLFYKLKCSQKPIKNTKNGKQIPVFLLNHLAITSQQTVNFGLSSVPPALEI